MNICFEVGRRSEVLDKVGGNSPLVSVGFVVKVNHMRLRIQLTRVRHEILDCVNVREGFHAKLGVETTTKGVEDLVLLLCTMPDVPLMHVSDCRV